MPSIHDYNWTEDHASARGTIGKDGSIQRIFLLSDWTQLGAFLAVLISGWRQVSATQWVYNGGDPHPDWPAMRCDSASYEGIGESSWDDTAKRSVWAIARVTATYKVPAFDPTQNDPATILEESLDFSANAVPLPSTMYQFPDGSDVPDEVALTRIVPTCAYSFTLVDVPTLPGGDTTLIFSLEGKVNGTKFRGAGPKCALYLGCTTDRTLTSAGTKGWKIQHKALVRPPGLEWTKIPNPVSGEWEEITTKVGGKLLYESADLTQLLPR